MSPGSRGKCEIEMKVELSKEEIEVLKLGMKLLGDKNEGIAKQTNPRQMLWILLMEAKKGMEKVKTK